MPLFEPTKRALLVIDYIDGIAETGSCHHYLENHPEVIENTNKLLHTFREQEGLIIHIRLAFDPNYTDLPQYAPLSDFIRTHHKFLIDTKETEFLPSINIQEEDIILNKKYGDPFYGNELEEILINYGIEDLIFTGMATDNAILNGAHSAMCRGFHVTVVTDACAAPTEQAHSSALEIMRNRTVNLFLTTEELIEEFDSKRDDIFPDQNSLLNRENQHQLAHASIDTHTNEQIKDSNHLIEKKTMIDYMNILSPIAFGAFLSRLSLHPLDTILTVQQSTKKPKSIIDSIRYIYRHHFLKGFYRGLSWPLLGSVIPVQLSIFGSYELSKRYFEQKGYSERQTLYLSSMLSSLAFSLVWTPFDSKRTKETLFDKANLKNLSWLRYNCRCFFPMMLKNSLGMPITLMGTDLLRKQLPFDHTLSYLIAGTMTGAMSQLVTTPPSVMKTRVMEDISMKQSLKLHAKQIFQEGAAFRSIQLRMLRFGLNNGIMFSTINTYKHYAAPAISKFFDDYQSNGLFRQSSHHLTEEEYVESSDHTEEENSRFFK